ncbi:MAG TPA: DUF6364 family protein [Terriglobales bacterium]|nr:DUF6364 family protein [Terriglobales bacterium]
MRFALMGPCQGRGFIALPFICLTRSTRPQAHPRLERDCVCSSGNQFLDSAGTAKGRALTRTLFSSNCHYREENSFDTAYVYTFTALTNVTLSIDEQLVVRARKKAEALGKSLNQLIRDYLQTVVGGNDPERSIEEFKQLSGKGHSRGWRFNRGEIHERP